MKSILFLYIIYFSTWTINADTKEQNFTSLIEKMDIKDKKNFEIEKTKKQEVIKEIVEHSNVAEGEEPEIFDEIDDTENENNGITGSTYPDDSDDKPFVTSSYDIPSNSITNNNNDDKGPPTVYIGGNTESGFEEKIHEYTHKSSKAESSEKSGYERTLYRKKGTEWPIISNDDKSFTNSDGLTESANELDEVKSEWFPKSNSSHHLSSSLINFLLSIFCLLLIY